MNKSTIMAFIAGAAIGSFAAWQTLKRRYEQIAQDEIDSVRKYYANKQPKKYDGPNDSEEAEKSVLAEKPDVAEYAKKLSQEGYTNYGTQKKESKESEAKGDRPYVISPDEFGELDDYTKISLFFYEDQVLADEMDEPVDNVEEIVGFDSLSRFGEYEDDSVFVRNDARKCDYEILRSLRRYSEVIAEKSYKAEV